MKNSQEHWASAWALGRIGDKPLALWVPRRLDVAEFEARLGARHGTFTRIYVRWRAESGGPWIYDGRRKAKPRAFDDTGYALGVLFDDNSPSFRGVDVTNARHLYEQRLANWRVFAELYRGYIAAFDPAPYRALLPPHETLDDLHGEAYRQFTPEQEDAFSVLRRYENPKGQLSKGFDSLILDPLVHDKEWFSYDARRRFGVTRPGKDRWFWCALPGRLLDKKPSWLEGFAASEEEAVAEVEAAVLETGPTATAWERDDATAKTRYREHHAKRTKHKDWTQTAKGTVWEDRRALWSYDNGVGDWQPYTPTWRPVPIVNLTAKFVYVLNREACQKLSWRGEALHLDRFSRTSYSRLDRASLEDEGYVYHDEWRDRLYAEPDLSAEGWRWDGKRYVCDEVVATATERAGRHESRVRADIKACRAILQRQHPDKGGDVDKFMAAKADLELLKAELSA